MPGTPSDCPKNWGLQCLRHSYVTHLIEAGNDPAFVQTQVGHTYASTTGLYTSVSSDFKQKTVQKMIARPITTLGDPDASCVSTAPS
jgi:integrase/recombinase XerD